jgi:hypothetical protein
MRKSYECGNYADAGNQKREGMMDRLKGVVRGWGLGLALCLALGPSALSQPAPVGPPNAIICNLGAQATVATATTTSLVAAKTGGVGGVGQSIYICGWHVTSTQSTSTTFQLEYGTQGGPCGTPTAITPAFSVTSTAPSADHIDYATLIAPAGTQLCVVTTGTTVGQAILVYYAQF